MKTDAGQGRREVSTLPYNIWRRTNRASVCIYGQPSDQNQAMSYEGSRRKSRAITYCLIDRSMIRFYTMLALIALVVARTRHPQMYQNKDPSFMLGITNRTNLSKRLPELNPVPRNVAIGVISPIMVTL